MPTQNFFAIDIGAHSIKLTQIERQGVNSAKLIALGSMDFPQGINSSTPSKKEPEKMALLASTIKSLVQSAGVKTKQVVSALPESLVFSKLLPPLPLVDSAKLEEMIYWQAKQVLPIPIDDAQIDWMEIEQTEVQGKKSAICMVIAAPKELVESYLQLFEMAELELIALEVESVAISRAIQFSYPGDQGVSMIIDMGGQRTDVCVMQKGRLIFSQSISTGSDSFTKAIVTDFGLQVAQAEQYKQTYGLLQNQADGGKIYNSIKPIVDVVLNEIRKIVGFTETRMNYGSPKQVYLSGNGALMPGLAQYLQANLNINTVLADPLTNVNLVKGLANVRNEVNPIGFVVSVGLGLKSE